MTSAGGESRMGRKESAGCNFDPIPPCRIEDNMNDASRNMTEYAEVTKTGALDMQVCVPADWTDMQVSKFADQANPCGTMNGWFVRKEGNMFLAGQPERQRCATRSGFVHIMLDA